MGHAQASHLMQSLFEVLKGLDYVNNMVQVAMDGPNVNLSVLDNLTIHWKEKNANAPDLVWKLWSLNCAWLSWHNIKEDRLEPGSIIKIFLQTP